MRVTRTHGLGAVGPLSVTPVESRRTRHPSTDVELTSTCPVARVCPFSGATALLVLGAASVWKSLHLSASLCKLRSSSVTFL